ncbi:MAG: hypothetical protein ACXIVF_17920 [Rhizobiaceae bacterium]
MPSLIEFLLTSFVAGFCLGAGAALWMIAGGIGPAAEIGSSWIACILFVNAIGGSLGLAYLSSAVLLAPER